MKFMNRMLVLTAVAALAACSSGRGEMLTLYKRQAVGSPFTRYMSQEYKDLADSMQGFLIGNSDMKHFAEKGLASADGVIVMPEVPTDWNLSDRDTVETTLSRASLIEALEGGGRDMAPAESAIAQSRFDCWVAEQGRNWNADVVCKRQFRNAMRLLRTAMGDEPSASPPATAPAPGAGSAAAAAAASASSSSASSGASDYDLPGPIGMTGSAAMNGTTTPAQQAMFLVFFDWNKSSLTTDANGVLDAVAIELKSRPSLKKVAVGGYADTSGSEMYNQTLSSTRAQTVRAALIQRGISADIITAIGHGEHDLLVKTPDNVREPGNRRAQITIEAE